MHRFLCLLPFLLLPFSLVVVPLCAKMSSQDPTVRAAARSGAVTAAVAVSRCGLAERLHLNVQQLLAGLDVIVEKVVTPQQAACKTPNPAV